MSDAVPRRVVVTHPQTVAPRRSGPSPAVTDIDEQTSVGEVLLESLIRAQLTLALRIGAVFVCLLGGLPLVFALVPPARSAEVAGIPVIWLILGVLVYPLLVAAGALFVRLAERNERDFTDLVDRT